MCSKNLLKFNEIPDPDLLIRTGNTKRLVLSIMAIGIY